MGMYQLKPSFAGGELTPALYGRIDLQKYDAGAAELYNAIVLRYGGVTRRNGFRFVTQTKNNAAARLIPFCYNTEQNYVLEFTPKKIRFFTQGGIIMSGDNPVEVTTPYLATDLAQIKYTQSADVLFLVHPNYPPATLTRYSNTSWAYAVMDIKNGPFDEPDTSGVSISASAATGNITLTASGGYFNSSMVGQLINIGHTVPGQYQKGVPLTAMSVTCVPGGTVYVESFGFWDGSFVVEKYTSSGWTTLKRQSGNRSQNYNMTFTNDDDEIRSYRVSSSEFDNSVHEGEDVNQRGYVTIQSFAKDYYGIAKITGISSSTSATATVTRQLGATSATNDFALQAWGSALGYPQAVGFFEDRLVFAGSKTQPQTYWASKSGDYYNFGTSIPSADDDAITGTLSSSAGQMNSVKAIVSFGEMIMLTSGGEYRVGGGGDAFTPSNQQARAQEYRGINDVMPVIIGGRIVYVQRHGSTIRDLAYAYEVDKYTGDDVSLLAAHLFDGKEIVGMAYQQTPNSVVWCVRNDGTLLGMTYIKEQDVYAWHQHQTDGDFIDVCSIPGDDEDELWACIKHGDDYCMEQMTPNAAPVFMDANYSVEDEEGISSLTGLAWLAGKTVQIVGDGHKLTGKKVAADGSIDIGGTFKSVQIGLEYDTRIRMLPIEFAGQDGPWGARKKRVQNVTVMFLDTIGGLFGWNENAMDEIKWRTTEPWGTPVEPYSGKKKITLPQSNYEETLMLLIKQSDPFPMTVLSIIPEVLPGG